MLLPWRHESQTFLLQAMMLLILALAQSIVSLENNTTRPFTSIYSNKCHHT